MISIEISDEQSRWGDTVDCLRSAAAMVLADAGVDEANVSLAIVDDPTIRELNCRYLGHDYATDVLSFLLERDGSRLEGEIVVSGDTATVAARQYGWKAEDELLLYVIHGALHLVGLDDASPEAAAQMRERESHYLNRFGLEPHQTE